MRVNSEPVSSPGPPGLLGEEVGQPSLPSAVSRVHRQRTAAPARARAVTAEAAGSARPCLRRDQARRPEARAGRATSEAVGKRAERRPARCTGAWRYSVHRRPFSSPSTRELELPRAVVAYQLSPRSSMGIQTCGQSMPRLRYFGPLVDRTVRSPEMYDQITRGSECRFAQRRSPWSR